MKLESIKRTKIDNFEKDIFVNLANIMGGRWQSTVLNNAAQTPDWIDYQPTADCNGVIVSCKDYCDVWNGDRTSVIGTRQSCQ